MLSILNKTAFSATLHCLTGCAIGEVLGMVIGGYWGWDAWSTVVLSVVLAFVFGYSFTLLPILRAGIPTRTALGLTLAADTASIAIMEVIDNALMLLIPGAMMAGLNTTLFWGSMVLSLVVAGAAAFPLNRWLIARGRGHAVVHENLGHSPQIEGHGTHVHQHSHL